MTEKKEPGQRDMMAEAKAAIERLRGYAADHSDELNGAIDRLGDFIDAQTGGRFAEKVDHAQESARRRLGKLASPTAGPAPAPADPFSLDDPIADAPGATAWRQPPGQAEHAATAAAHSAKAELVAAVERLRLFAADNKENLSGLVDKVGDFVDAQTAGRYADRIDKLQASAKDQIDKRLTKPGNGTTGPTPSGGPAN